MPSMPEEMSWDQLVGEYNNLKLGHGGLRTKDIQYKHALKTRSISEKQKDTWR